jgi:hypothetical protein
VDALVGGHRGRGVDVCVVGGAGFCALREGQHEDRPEVSREDAEEAGLQVRASRIAHMIAEQVQPVLLVASFGVCQREQDVTFLAGLALGQMPVHTRFGAFIGQVLTPATQIGSSRLALTIHVAIIPRNSSTRILIRCS